jgi:hypothetical protein
MMYGEEFTMTVKEYEEQLHREANSDRVWLRDHALELWNEDYDRKFPRPANAVNATQPGA